MVVRFIQDDVLTQTVVKVAPLFCSGLRFEFGLCESPNSYLLINTMYLSVKDLNYLMKPMK